MDRTDSPENILMNADIYEIRDNLTLIELPPVRPGFENFLAVWVIRHNGRTLLLDTGPAACAPALADSLERLEIESLDYILLTHIHLDHAGGIGHFSNRYPGATVVCHPKAVSHLADPRRLREGTLKTLGRLAEDYGGIEPVAAERLLSADRLTDEVAVAIETPGHAAHHLSFRIGENLFVGEAGGVCLLAPAAHAYMRPATPPPLYLDAALKSIERLLEQHAGLHCYSHFGWTEQGSALLRRHRSQLKRWQRIILDRIASDGVQAGAEKCLQTLLEQDEELIAFHKLPHAVQKRECFFMLNSIRGFYGYLKTEGHLAHMEGSPLDF